jgi:DNA topoisomerase IB
MDPRGHLQATGVDVAGRKQYLYHEHWRAHRDRLKFDAMLQFGRALPLLRRRVGCDLRAPSDKRDRLRVDQLTPERVLACAVRLLDVGFFRIGSEDYAEHNSSYGLTTMLLEHVTVAAGELVFEFPAKSGQRRVQEIDDRDALEVVAALKRRRGGEQLLAYRAGRGWADCSAAEVNTYIAEYAGGPFTAKDFRTWHATVLAAAALAAHARKSGAEATRTHRDREVSAAIKSVADHLGNTPAVCRASYVDPRLIDHYHAGATIAPALGRLMDGRNGDGPELSSPRVRRRVEMAVLDLLDDC